MRQRKTVTRRTCSACGLKYSADRMIFYAKGRKAFICTPCYAEEWHRFVPVEAQGCPNCPFGEMYHDSEDRVVAPC